eukprot:CAMPEP_0194326436 /NCGR_PEP_ID=MMETSP0171-20130528/36467_1 /TAXON_ID=218684 /ORGANISM="Corethron pennatum, Strain L29A3" /LENGTH=206 /DNA_ID=CAMNT_0039086009 /DNA_START=109 /DNA_END=730 /DNA_ORIENTATION=-
MSHERISRRDLKSANRLEFLDQPPTLSDDNATATDLQTPPFSFGSGESVEVEGALLHERAAADDKIRAVQTPPYRRRHVVVVSGRHLPVACRRRCREVATRAEEADGAPRSRPRTGVAPRLQIEGHRKLEAHVPGGRFPTAAERSDPVLSSTRDLSPRAASKPSVHRISQPSSRQIASTHSATAGLRGQNASIGPMRVTSVLRATR